MRCTSVAMQRLLVSACVALLLVASAGVSPAAAQHDAHESTTSYYGVLDLPSSYFSHPDSEVEINRVQAGRVMLTNGHGTISVPVQKDGSFVVYNLPYGTYLLQADYHDFTFPTVRVEVQYKDRLQGAVGDVDAEEAAEEAGVTKGKTVRVPVIRTYANDFPVKPLRGAGVDEQSPAMIPAQGTHGYYIPREEFSPLDLLKNPMILMMLVSFSLMGMTKLFPEEDVKESQKMTREWQKKLMEKARKRTSGES